MLREIISRCKTIKYCADNFTQDFGLDFYGPTASFFMPYLNVSLTENTIYSDTFILPYILTFDDFA